MPKQTQTPADQNKSKNAAVAAKTDNATAEARNPDPAVGAGPRLGQSAPANVRPPEPKPEPAPEKEEAPSTLEVEFAVESVTPTGNGRDTSTVVLGPVKNSESNRKFFRQAAGRVSLSDVREPVAALFRAAHMAKITFAPVKRPEGENAEPVY